MKLTWMGTACFALESGSERILFDPFIELAGGTTAAAPEDLAAYDTVFVTHCHFDHLFETAQIAGQEEGDLSVFCTQQCCRTLEGFLEDESCVAQIRHGQTYDLYRRIGADEAVPEPGQPGFVRISVLHGRHIRFRMRYVPETMNPVRMLRYAGNLPFLFWANRTFREGGEIAAFDIEAEGKRILLLGSLALDPEETYPAEPDVLILPYQGSNDLPSCARAVLRRIRPKRVILSHFDNAFPPMSRDVDLGPLKKLIREEFPQIRVAKPAAFRPIIL